MAGAGASIVIERLLMLCHFVATRWLPEWADREKKRCRFLKRVRRESPFYRDKSEELPVMSKSEFLAHFEKLNRHGITLEEATAVALRAERERDFQPTLQEGVTVGLSSGTSGARHVFLVGRADRCRWAGQMLARMLSSESLRQVLIPWASPLRIAFFLRASSNLYTTLSGRRVHLEYYDLTRPFDELVAQLVAASPHILVAPATVLAELARHVPHLRPRQIISVAEVLDVRDRAAIEQTFQVRVDEIYQAAEGFLGCSCLHGRMHLNEETLHVEPRWLDDRQERFQPIITDFSRSTQWFVRHQLNDILRIHPTPCPCGRQTMTLLSIEGRAEEVLWLRDAKGILSPVFPDVLRRALYGTPVPLDLYRIEQHGLRWEIRLKQGDETAVREAIKGLVNGLRLQPPELHFLGWTEQASTEKQKRIRCITKPE